MPGTKVVQSNAEPHAAQGPDGAPGNFRVGHGGGFCDFQNDPVRADPVPAGDGAGFLMEQWMGNVFGRDVDGNTDAFPVALLQWGKILAGLVQYPQGHGMDDAHLFGQGNPVIRGNPAKFRMLPANQRLG